MKKILISLLFVLPFLFSCQQQVEPFTPGEEEVSGCYGVYFPSQEATGSHTLDPTMAPEATFTAMRKNTSGSITVPLVVKSSADGIFDVGPLTFADGQSEATFTVKFPKSELGTTYNLSIAIDDPQYASKYQDQPIAFDYSCLRVEWVNFGHATFYEGWWGEVHTANIKYYEVNGVRTCVAECDEGNGIWGDSVNATIQFTWYTKNTNSDGYQLVAIPKQYFGFDYADWGSKPVEEAANPVFLYDYYTYWIERGESLGSFLDFAANYGDIDGSYPVSYYDGNGGFMFNARYYIPGLGGFSPDPYELQAIVDGFTRVDYSIEAATDFSHEGEVPVYLTVGPDVAKVVYAAYPGELTPAQVETKVASIEADDNAEVVEEFEEGDGEKYADFTMNLGTTGFYTLVAVTFDEKGNAQESATALLNYVSADDEETYKVIVDCATEPVPARYEGFDPKYSFAYYVVGKDLTDAHVAVYAKATVDKQPDAVMNDIKTKHAVDEATLAQINANGGWFTVADGLKADTEYVLLVWATNGMEEACVSSNWTTDPLPYVWKYLGKGQLTDDVACGIYGIDPVTVTCDIYEEETHPGLFRVTGYQVPLVATLFMEEGDVYEEVEESIRTEYEDVFWRNTFLEIDAQNPADVRIALQDYGVCLSTDDGFIDGVTNVYNGEPFSVGTFEDGVISFPTEKGMLATLNGEGYYYANQHGAFQIVLPNENGNEEPEAAPAKVSFKKGTNAVKSLFKARQTSFERGQINSVKASVTKVAHKAKETSRKLVKD